MVPLCLSYKGQTVIDILETQDENINKNQSLYYGIIFFPQKISQSYMSTKWHLYKKTNWIIKVITYLNRWICQMFNPVIPVICDKLFCLYIQIHSRYYFFGNLPSCEVYFAKGHTLNYTERLKMIKLISTFLCIIFKHHI